MSSSRPWSCLLRWARTIALMGVALCPIAAALSLDEVAGGPRKTVVVLYSLPQDMPGLRELSTAITQMVPPGGVASRAFTTRFTTT